MKKSVNSFDKLISKLINLKDKSVLISGGASGIGSSVADLFAGAGAKVVIADFNKAAGITVSDELTAKYKVKVSFVETDVTSAEQCQRAATEAAKSNGCLDILVTSAGIVRPADGRGNSVEEIRQMMDVNFFGTVQMVQAAQNLMQSKGGRIVCLGSIAGETMIANRDGYCASKAALHSWAMVRAPELRRENIILNVLAPGRVLTDLVKGWVSKNADPKAAFRAGCATQCSGTMLLPEAVAEMAFILCSELYSVTGTVVDLSDGWGRGFQGDVSKLPDSFEEFCSYAINNLAMSAIN